MEQFDESEKDDPCRELALKDVPKRLAKSIRPDCFAHAFAKNKSSGMEGKLPC